MRYVNWLTPQPIPRWKLNSSLAPLLCTPHGFLNATEHYSDFINQTIYPIYVSNDKYHVNIPVTLHTNESFTDDNYRYILNALKQIRLQLTMETGINFYTQEMELKINIQSPGWLTFTGPIAAVLVILILGTVGGNIKISANGMNLDLNTNSILEEYNRHEEKIRELELEELQKIIDMNPQLAEEILRNKYSDKNKALNLLNRINIKNHPALEHNTFTGEN